MYASLRRRRRAFFMHGGRNTCFVFVLTLAGFVGLTALYITVCRDGYVDRQRWVNQERATFRLVGTAGQTATPATRSNQKNTDISPIIENTNESNRPSVSKAAENVTNLTSPAVSSSRNTKKSKGHSVSKPKNVSLFQARYGTPFNTRKFTSAVGKLNSDQLNSWSYNTKELETFRQYLVSALWRGGKSYPFYLTKESTKLGSTLPYYGGGRPENVSELLWHSLPERAIVRSDRRFPTCSIVGSSGILLGSGCGPAIDSADFVIRFNVATVRGFEADVGGKTNVTTLNPTYVRNRFGSLRSDANVTAFRAELEQFRGSLVMIPLFGLRVFRKMSLRAAQAVTGSGLTQAVYGDPRHFLAVRSVWRPILNTGKLPTTGLYLLTAAFEFCDRLKLFGAWPLEKSPANKTVPYHYHDNVNLSRHHNFPGEFWNMLKMHNAGIVKLQHSDCSVRTRS